MNKRNKRVEIASKVLMSLATSSEGEAKKTLDECRKDAATIIATLDMLMLTPDKINTAIVDAGYEPSEYSEQFLRITNELNSLEEDAKFFLNDMEKAWATGHENGFWDARQTDAVKPEPVTPTESRTFFSEDDLKNAEAQGYVSGWQNGVLSETVMESSEKLLLGAQHEKATNPYSAQNLANEKLREGKEGHAMWCAGNHEGECQRGRVTGTEGSADND